jgi:hypothetical protein
MRLLVYLNKTNSELGTTPGHLWSTEGAAQREKIGGLAGRTPEGFSGEAKPTFQKRLVHVVGE